MIEIKDIAINQIEPNSSQPRKHFEDDSLQELAESIKTKGLLEPIVVRSFGEKYQIVCGERRWRACKIAGLETIQGIVRECSDDEAFEISLTENVQRENLNPIEEAAAYQSMIDEGSTQQKIADAIGKGRTYVAHKLRLMELPPAISESVSRDTLSEGHARQLLRLKKIFDIDTNDANAWQKMAIEIAERSVRKKLTVSDVQKEIDSWKEYIDCKKWIRNYADVLAKNRDVNTLADLRTSLHLLIRRLINDNKIFGR